MSLWQSYRNLSFGARLGVGVGFIAWSAIGLYLSDRTEEKLGFKPTEQDKATLDRYIPKIQVVEKEEKP